MLSLLAPPQILHPRQVPHLPHPSPNLAGSYSKLNANHPKWPMGEKKKNGPWKNSLHIWMEDGTPKPRLLTLQTSLPREAHSNLCPCPGVL